MIGLIRSLLNSIKKHTVDKLGTALLFLAIFAYSVTGFMYFELQANPELSWNDSIWWSFVTMTTVGYGDLYPQTYYGRIFIGLPTMILGVSILGYILSLLASTILEAKIKEIKGLKSVKLFDHIIICHFNSIEETLKLIHEIRKDQKTKDKEIVLIDAFLEELPDELDQENIFFVRGCPSREDALYKANFTEASHIIIQAITGDFEHSDHKNLAIALTIESLKSEVFTIVECIKAENKRYFEHAQVDSIICNSTLNSQLIIQELQDPGVNQVINELTSNEFGDQMYLSPIATCKSIDEIKAKTPAQATFIGIRRGAQSHFSPSESFSVQERDLAIFIAESRPSLV